ncbi:RNA polymerase sigma factor [Quadrisphaera setariae]|uniref:RNA polymerase sigma factor n=1 Tax=Quadrisphaera setariae TaxID=2593304 RepID=UPI001C9CB56E|nr:RNA polymerase sigma factor [Quadrisphaera setariae]
MDGIDDTEPWACSLRGDGYAFGLLFDRHHAHVYRHAHRLTAQRDDAEDLTAGAFLELWRRRQDVRLVSGSVLPWLLVTTANLARNHHRGLRRHRAFLDRVRMFPENLEAKLHESDLGRGGQGASDGWSAIDGPWAKALAQLNAADLRLVTLVVLEEYSLAEAADLLDTTPQAAKTRMHRAKKRLRAAFERSAPRKSILNLEYAKNPNEYESPQAISSHRGEE